MNVFDTFRNMYKCVAQFFFSLSPTSWLFSPLNVVSKQIINNIFYHLTVCTSATEELRRECAFVALILSHYKTQIGLLPWKMPFKHKNRILAINNKYLSENIHISVREYECERAWMRLFSFFLSEIVCCVTALFASLLLILAGQKR